jgi:Rieske Fe-S protein
VRREARAPLRPWDEEFPLESAEERYVTRRQFLRFLTLTSVGMLVGNLVILARSRMRRHDPFPASVVARVDELAIGGVKLFRYPAATSPCILVRTGPDEFAAYAQTCTHLSCPVYYAPASNRLECPCHRGAFSLRDGRVLQGPPMRPLPRIRLERRGGDLVATGVETAGES